MASNFFLTLSGKLSSPVNGEWHARASSDPVEVFHGENVFCESWQYVTLVSLLSQVGICLLALLHLFRSIILFQRMYYNNSFCLHITSKFSSD